MTMQQIHTLIPDDVGHFHPGAGPNHIVQFYDSEDFLSEIVAEFLAEGLTARQPLVVIATEPRRQSLLAGLRFRGFDVGSRSRGQVIFLDAREMLSTFMVDSMPDPERFKSAVGSVIERSGRRTDRPCVRAYGEMVDVLWKDGNPAAAIRLEGLWNELASTHAFSLMCTYAMGHFLKAADGHRFEEICRRHTHVIPAESYIGADGGEAQMREIGRLQQRSRALETELAHGKELEQALRHALVERQQAEAERERLLASERTARAEAENANRLKDEFLALLSHELRTPVDTILGWIQSAGARQTDDPTMRRALEVIGRNAAVQTHLIDDLLDVSRSVTATMQIGTDPVDLVAVAAAAIDSVRPVADENAIDLIVHFDEPTQSVTGDAARLHQVIWSLLSNAVKFTPRGGRVHLRVGRAASDAHIVVRDTGPGIAPDFLPHVFDGFRQADTSTTRALGGLGLGLSLVRSLAEAHGGTVSADNDAEGHGAIFTVTIPLRAGRVTSGT